MVGVWKYEPDGNANAIAWRQADPSDTRAADGSRIHFPTCLTIKSLTEAGWFP